MNRKIEALGFSVTLLAVLASPSGQAGGQQTYYDYARVIRVEPIRDTISVPTEQRVCSGHGRQPLENTGSVEFQDPGLSLGEVIGRDTRNRYAGMRQPDDCRTETVWANKEAVAAYRVWYRYGGETFVRRMPEDPGERIKVRVGLDAISP